VLRGLPLEAELAAGARQHGLLDLRKLYAQGKAILVHSVQLRVPAVAALAGSLKAVFHCR